MPAYSSQVYIIHSLKSRSSRHALTTYKNKFILKFGGVKKLLEDNKDKDLEYVETYCVQP